MEPGERTYKMRGSEIARFLKERRVTQAALAVMCGVDAKTIRRWIKGGEAYAANITRLAEALKVSPNDISHYDGIEPSGQGTTEQKSFSYTLAISGILETAGQLGIVARLTPQVLDLLAQHGITVVAINNTLSTGEEYTVVLLQGMNTNGLQIYCYVKVMLDQFDRLVKALESPDPFNVLDYGTVLASGYDAPPKEVLEAILAQHKGTAKDMPTTDR